jgi:hypothetical protein
MGLVIFSLIGNHPLEGSVNYTDVSTAACAARVWAEFHKRWHYTKDWLEGLLPTLY